MARLEGTSAIVTGAAQGIGATYARALAADGARVSVCDLDPPDTVVQAIQAAGGEAIGRICDVSNPEAVSALVRATEQAFGGVQVLVNNAALFGKIARKPFAEIDSDEWDRVMAVNTRGPCECVKAVLPVMRRQGYGKIINIASTSGHWGRKEATAYTTAKAGVLNLTRSIAVQLAPEGIRVNSISPNRIGSPVGQQEVPENRFVKNLAGRRGVPMDIAKAAVFLASDESEFIYAVDLPVDGGALAIRD